MEERCLAPRYMTSHAVIKMEEVQAWALIRYGHTDEIPPLGVYGSKGGRYMTSHAVIKWKEYRRGLEMRSSGTAILMKYLLLESTDQRGVGT